MGLLDDIIAGIDAEPDDKQTKDKDGMKDPVDGQGDDKGTETDGKGHSWYGKQFLEEYPQSKDQ